MTAKKQTALQFVPLGGSGEIGMNMNLYGYGDRWIMVDCGVTFNKTLGIDLLMADPSFILEHQDKLLGIVLTHGHEDHLGAVPYLWPHLECPIYATKFTAAFLKTKVEKLPFYRQMKINVVESAKPFNLGPFEVELLELTHSIPEQNGVILRSPAGTIFHTGDWKFDEDPQLGAASDRAGLEKIAKEGVLAVVCDSTNAMEEGSSGSEADVYKGVEDVVAMHTDKAHGGKAKKSQRVLIACFASNVARLYTIARIAQKFGRKVGILGRSLQRMEHVARSCGYLSDIPAFLSAEDIAKFPPEETILICTGSQGEPRAALARLGADGGFDDVKLTDQDVVLFSSRKIPGNEREINVMKNALVARGVELLTEHHEHPIHVSGHPNQDELKEMYDTLKPQIVIPVHGELQHMQAQARWARKCGVSQALVVQNGDWITLSTQEGAKITSKVAKGQWALDGKMLVPFDAEPLKERVRMVMNGVVFITIVVEEDANGRPVLMDDGIELTVEGLVVSEEFEAKLLQQIQQTLYAMPEAMWHDDGLIQETLRRFIRKTIETSYGRKPRTSVHVIRLSY